MFCAVFNLAAQLFLLLLITLLQLQIPFISFRTFFSNPTLPIIQYSDILMGPFCWTFEKFALILPPWTDYLVDEECNTTSDLLSERNHEQSLVDLLIPTIVLLINLLQKLQVCYILFLASIWLIYIYGKFCLIERSSISHWSKVVCKRLPSNLDAHIIHVRDSKMLVISLDKTTFYLGRRIDVLTLAAMVLVILYQRIGWP